MGFRIKKSGLILTLSTLLVVFHSGFVSASLPFSIACESVLKGKFENNVKISKMSAISWGGYKASVVIDDENFWIDPKDHRLVRVAKKAILGNDRVDVCTKKLNNSDRVLLGAEVW